MCSLNARSGCRFALAEAHCHVHAWPQIKTGHRLLTLPAAHVRSSARLSVSSVTQWLLNVLEALARCLNAVHVGDDCTDQRCDDQDDEQRLCADVFEQNGKEESG